MTVIIIIIIIIIIINYLWTWVVIDQKSLDILFYK